MKDPIRFLRDIAGFSEAQRRRTSADRRVRLATIDPDHRPEDIFGGIFPKVRFDGESTLSRKRYPLVSGILPRPGDRVVLTPVGTTYLITNIIYDPGSAPEPDTRIIIKETDQSVTSSTTLVNDDDLFALVESNAVYLVRLQLQATGAETGDIKTAWSIPTGTDIEGRWVHGPGRDATLGGGGATMQTAAAGWTTEREYGTTTSFNISILEWGLLRTGSSSGFLRLQWAQRVSDATATTVSEPSVLRVQRIWDNQL